MHAVCVCCVCKRERERERERGSTVMQSETALLVFNGMFDSAFDSVDNISKLC